MRRQRVLEPTAVTAVATSTTDVDVSWTTGGSTAWQIEYGAPGFTPGTGTIVNGAHQSIYSDRSYVGCFVRLSMYVTLVVLVM
jgi:hypothetical protein